MKKLIGPIAAIMVCCTAMFSACLSIHDHQYVEEWTYDASNHWHEPTCEHTDKKGSFMAHDFSEWETVGLPDNGIITMRRSCSVCGYIDTKQEGEHVHAFAEKWTCDETNHWHVAICEHENEKDSFGPHEFDSGVVVDKTIKYTCNSCGYYKTEASNKIVTAEEFKSILCAVKNYKMSAIGESSAFYATSADGVFCYNTTGGYTCYYAFNGEKYVYLEKGSRETDFVENESSKEAVDGKIAYFNFLTKFAEEFSSFTFNTETKTYDTESLVVIDNYGNSVPVNKLSISFEDGKFISATYKEMVGGEEFDYKYIELKTDFPQLPTNIHEHTFATEWSIGSYWHYHESTCGHNNVTKDKADHTFEKGVCTVCGFNALEITDNGTTVSGLKNENVTSITIPAGVTKIANSAFWNCYQLTEIDIPEGVTTIGYSAFADCTGLTKVTLPNTLTSIGYKAFENCPKLTEITLPGGLEYVPMSIFKDCTNLKTVNFTEGITDLWAYVFWNCTSLTEIVIPNSVTSINNSAFTYSSLTKIYYKGSKTEWKQIEGDYGVNLNSATLYFYSETDPDVTGNFWHYDAEGKIAEWPVHTFEEDWSNDETYHWHVATCEHTDKKGSFGEHAYIEGAETVNGIELTCSACGYKKYKLSRYMITEEDFKRILTEVKKFKLVATGKGGYTVILGDVSYFEDSDRTRYYLFEGDKYYQVFQEDSEWIKEEIDKYQYDFALSRYGILDALSEYYSKLEYDVETKSYKANSIGISPVGGGLVTTYYQMTVSFENKALISVSYYRNLNGGRQDCVYSGIGMENAVLPDIHEHTFKEEWSYDDQNHWHSANCSHIYERSDEGKHTFEKGVCTVCGFNALEITDNGTTVSGLKNENVTSITIPAGVTKIANSAFWNCYQLTELDIPEGVTAIEEYAFYGCTGLTRIALPNTLTAIEGYAFCGCTALKEIILPESITKFDFSAFVDCSISIYYEGSKSDWLTMTEGSDVMGNVTLNFYSETDPADIGNFWYYDENGNIAAWPVHTFAEEWSHDENNHWRVTICEHTGIKGMFGPHTFDDVVVDGDRMKFTCTACGYSKTEESPYLVKEEEFKNILNSVNIFKVKVSGVENFTAILNDVRYYESNDSIIYYIFENGNYFAISKDGDQWVKDETAKESYDSISNYNLFSVFSEYFSVFIFDLETNSYNAYKIIIPDENGNRIFYYEVSVSFENNAVTSLAFGISNYGLNFEYSEIGTASKDLPADIHEHTFKEEWWHDDSTHCHYATCEHGTATKDSGFHTFEKGVCTECGFNALIVSDDGTTVIGIADARDDEGYRLEYNGFTIPEGVTAIGNHLFDANKTLTEIDIPEGVTAIGEYAFAWCSNLTRVSLPNTLTSINNSAFFSCIGLTEISLPSNLTDIGSQCFMNCTGLTEITIPFGVTQICQDLVNGCTSLKTVNLPDTVTSIDYDAFYGCTALTEMVIPNSVTKLKSGVITQSGITKIYYGGTQAEFVKISGVNYISDLTITVYFYSETEPTEEGNFWHYDEEGKIEVWHIHTYEEKWSTTETEHWHAATCEHTDIKDSLGSHDFDITETENNTVFTCSVCGYTEIKDSIYKVADEAAFDSLIESINNYEFVTSDIGFGGEEYFDGITRYNPDSEIYFTKDGDNYYMYRGELEDEATLKYYEDYIKTPTTQDNYDDEYIKLILSLVKGKYNSVAYDYTSKSYKGTDVELTDGVAARELIYRFENGKIKEIRINITDEVFYYFLEIGDVKLELPKVHEHVFSENWSSDNENHYHALAFCTRHDEEANKEEHIWQNNICSVCGYNALAFSDDGKTVTGLNNEKVTSVIIPQGVTAIADYAFTWNNKSLEEVYIPDGVESIGVMAFYRCEYLSKISLPSTLKSIGSNAFMDCSSLTSVTIPQSVTRLEAGTFENSGLTSIVIPDSIIYFAQDVLANCSSLVTVKLPGCLESIHSAYLKGCSSLTTLILSENTKTLGIDAFKDCTKLVTIVIPESINEIQSSFYSDITTVYYAGNQSGWEKVYITLSAKQNLASATVYYYSETAPETEGNYWSYVNGVPTNW